MSLEVDIKLTTLELDMGRFSRTLQQEVLVQMRNAARAYVRVASAAVPFRTGFARGIFRNILQQVGASGGNVERDIPGSTQPFGNPLNSLRILKKHGNKFVRIDKFPNVASIFRLDARTLRKAGATGKFEFYKFGSQKILKTPQSGRQFATPPGNIISFSNFTFRFNFSTSISYFPKNDTKGNKGHPAWGSFAKGKAFFLQYMRTIGLKRLPKVNNFLFSTHIHVNGDTIQRTEAGVLGRGRNDEFRIK